MKKTDDSFKNGSVHKREGGSVGPQGTGGEMAGKPVASVNNPRGMEPKSIGGGRMPLSQGPVEPKVGK